MSTMSGPYAAVIQRGMALLDEQVPDWWQRIRVDRLMLEDCKNCVVGQLFGADPSLLGTAPIADDGDGFDLFAEGVERLGIEDDDHLYGFNLSPYLGDGEGTWLGLTRAWRQAIRARQADPSAGEVIESAASEEI